MQRAGRGISSSTQFIVARSKGRKGPHGAAGLRGSQQPTEGVQRADEVPSYPHFNSFYCSLAAKGVLHTPPSTCQEHHSGLALIS